MKLATTLFFVFASLICFAQTSALRIEPANVTKEVVVDDFESGYQDVTNITVTNTGDRVMDVRPEQFAGKKPASWSYGVFSRRNDSAPFTVPRTEGEATAPVRLGPGESAKFSIVLSSGGVTGSGTVGVIFTDVNTPGVTLGTANFTTRIVRRADTAGASGVPTLRRPTPTRVNLYPNPARERFFVEVPGGTRLGRVEVANTLGKRVLKFDQPAGKEGYDVDKLPDGLYLISIYDDKGKKLKTLRLLHRRFGA